MSAVLAAAHAQDVLNLYAPSTLRDYEMRIGPNLRGMWDEDFLSRLTREERVQGGRVVLIISPVGVTHQPLEFYSDPPKRQVFFPISSVKFVDDLSLAFAYYGSRGCDVDLVSDYAAALRFHPREARGSPLLSLGVPLSAYEAPDIDGPAQKILKSILFFVAAHEYAHVMYRHRSYTEITAPQAQQQEMQADRFALEVMRRIGLPPTGVVFFFLVASRLEVTPGDFASPQAYETYLRQHVTHPVSASRVLAIADFMDDNRDAFSQSQVHPDSWQQRLHGEAEQMREIARTLDDRRMRNFLANRVRDVDLAYFKHACGD
jgi:hypothetical protein